MIQILSTIGETQVQSLGQEDPLEKGMTAHSSILAWRIPWIDSLAGYSPQGRKGSDTTEQLTSFHTYNEEKNKRQNRSLYCLLPTRIGFEIVERTFNIVEKTLN